MSKIKLHTPYKILRHAGPVGTYAPAYFDGNGNAIFILNGKPEKFDPQTGACISNQTYRIEL